MTDIPKLIEKIEDGATDRETADEVLLAAGWKRITSGPVGWWYNPMGAYVGSDNLSRPNPLQSVDAAIAMMPEGFESDNISFLTHSVEAWVKMGIDLIQHGPGKIYHGPGKAPTEAPARTNAALLAIHAQREKQDD